VKDETGTGTICQRDEAAAATRGDRYFYCRAVDYPLFPGQRYINCLANSLENGQFKIECKVKESYQRFLKEYLDYREEKEIENDKTNHDHDDDIVRFINRL
jgi:hypothetical protein